MCYRLARMYIALGTVKVIFMGLRTRKATDTNNYPNAFSNGPISVGRNMG